MSAATMLATESAARTNRGSLPIRAGFCAINTTVATATSSAAMQIIIFLMIGIHDCLRAILNGAGESKFARHEPVYPHDKKILPRVHWPHV